MRRLAFALAWAAIVSALGLHLVVVLIEAIATIAGHLATPGA